MVDLLRSRPNLHIKSWSTSHVTRRRHRCPNAIHGGSLSRRSRRFLHARTHDGTDQACENYRQRDERLVQNTTTRTSKHVRPKRTENIDKLAVLARNVAQRPPARFQRNANISFSIRCFTASPFWQCRNPNHSSYSFPSFQVPFRAGFGSDSSASRLIHDCRSR